jgi:protein SCO1
MTIASPASSPALRLTSATSRFLAGGKFPAFAIFALVFYQIFVGIMAFSPPSTGVWGEFLEDFRMRCFRFDPGRGWMDMGSVWIMLSEPVALEVILVLFWWKPLRELWTASRRSYLTTSIAALALVGAIAASLLGLGRAKGAPIQVAFPADRLRSALPMPAFNLQNQDGEALTPEMLKGRVVLVTAVYSTCTTACPMMLSRIRDTLNALTAEDRKSMSVVAISLNPETDTRELREAIARMYGMKSDFHFVNGGAKTVNSLLDDLGVSRTFDKESGQVIHSSLFMLVDRKGRIAYRLSSSSTEQAWLTSAIRTLIAEKAQ